MRIRPSIRLTALPSGFSFDDRFAMAAHAGFEGVELDAGSGPPAEIKEAAERHGIAVHSVHTYQNWSHPLSSGDPKVVAAGIDYTLAALEEARALGAETLLLIPGRVAGGEGYRAAYDRSHAVISREILPAAAELGITLGVENVWNGFLLGPIEYVQYCDSFESPWVRPYLDVGNVVFGRPEDWIEICGDRIVALHLKDFHLNERNGMFLRFAHTRIGDGAVDWGAVRGALDRAGFSGWGVFAQAEFFQNAVALGARKWARRAHKLLGPVPFAGAAAGAAQALLARRLLDDVMARYRRHLA